MGEARAMETTTVGKVIVSGRIENLFDLERVFLGQINDDQARRLEVEDAMIDTGSTSLSLPKQLIEQLVLRQIRLGRARTASGMATFGIYSPVRLTVQGRDCTVEGAELPDECPPLIGVIPLEILDFVVDSKNQLLMGNPDHGGEFMFDMYRQSPAS
jgi:predicted aspartyl protease